MARGSDQAVASAARAMARSSMIEVEQELTMEIVDWSCCCCSQRMGVQVLGVGFLILSLGALVVCSMEAAALSNLYTDLRANASDMANVTKSTAVTPKPKVVTPQPKVTSNMNVMANIQIHNTEANRRLVKGMYVVLAAQAIVAAAGAASSALLVAGAATRRSQLLLPWMATSGAELALLLGGGGYLAVVCFSKTLPLIGIHGFFAFVFMLFACIPVLYCMKVVHLLFNELRGLKRVEVHRKAHAKEGVGEQRGSVKGPRPHAPPPPPPAALEGTTTQARPRYGSLGHENPAYQSTAL